jgi:hypothetical protein
MPLLEKAWAKYFDAYPALSSYPQELGYAKIAATSPGTALAAMTGGRPVQFYANNPTGMKNLLQTCLTTRDPCVFGSPYFDALNDGTRGSGSFDDQGIIRLYSARKADGTRTTIAKIQSVYDPAADATSDGQVRITDYNRVVNGKASIIRLPLGHAYAINTTDSVWSTDAKRCRVTLINPWGTNPAECRSGTPTPPTPGCTGPAAFQISCSAFLGIASGLWSVTNRQGPFA